MFLVDKYFNDSNQYIWHHSIIEKILDKLKSLTGNPSNQKKAFTKVTKKLRKFKFMDLDYW